MELTRQFCIAVLVLSGAMPGFSQANITEIEINQALGRQLNGNLNFVAGKDTVIRVYLDSAVAIAPDKTSLAIQVDGKDLTTLMPPAYPDLLPQSNRMRRLGTRLLRLQCNGEWRHSEHRGHGL